MEFVIGIFMACVDGDFFLLKALDHSPMSMERAEFKVETINRQLGFELDDLGCFTTKPGEIFAMYDHKDDIGPMTVVDSIHNPEDDIRLFDTPA